MKRSLLLMLMALLMSISGWSQVETQVGEATSSSYYTPSYCYYNYSISQTLYTQEEMSEVPTGTITSISYQNSYYYGATRTWKILVGETDLTSISNSSFVEEANLTEVFSGSVTAPAQQWVTINFATPYTYQGGNLVVTVLDITGSYIGNYPAWATFASSDPTLWAARDDGQYSVSYLANANGAYYKPVIKLVVTPDGNYCAPVSNLTVGNITATTASVSWSGMDNVSNFLYQVKKTSDAWTDGGDQTSSTNTVALTDLLPNTSYDIRVKADCGNTQSNYRTTTFYTACSTVTTLPWTADFENETAYETPRCWAQLNPYGDYPQVTQQWSSSNVYKVLEFRAGDSKSIAILPAFSTEINQLQLSLYTKRASQDAGTLLIGYVTNIDDTNTFVAIDTITATSIGDDDYHLVDIPFDNVTIEDGVTPRMAIAYHTMDAYSYAGWYVDDVTVSTIPACTRPMALTSVPAGQTATITWTSTGNNFEVYYKEVGSTDDYQVVTNFTSSTEVENTHTITLTNLTSVTNYTYYINAICGEDTVKSEEKTFRTECIAIATLPQSWDFETYEAETELPSCWTKIPADTYSVRCSDYYSVSGSRSLYIWGGGPIAVLPGLDLEQLEVADLQLKFKARYGWDNVTLQVGVVSDPNDISTFETVASFPLTNTFTEKLVMFSSYTGQGRYIALRGVESSAMYIDDMVLEEIPACPPVQQIQVTSVTTNSATISWTGFNESYLVRYRSEEDSVWNTNNVTTTGSTATISELTEGTTYIVAVAPDCEETTDSTFRATYFSTLCSPKEAPYFMDFEDTDMLNCWTVASSSPIWDYWYGDLDYPVVFQSEDEAHSSLLFWGIRSNGTDPIVVVAPKINLDIEQTRFQFYVKKNTTNYGYGFGNIEVGVMTNPVDTNTFVPLYTINEANITTQYSLQQIDFNQFDEYTGNTYYVAIRYLDASNPDYRGTYYIDDVTITNVPSCAAPTGLVASNPTTNSIDLTWTSEESDFKVYYKPASAGDEVSYSSVDATLTDGIYTLAEDDIEPSTVYQYYVATVCSDNTESSSEISTFTTQCVSLDIPYTMDFEEVATGSRPVCWSFINNVSTDSFTYPCVSSANRRGHNSSKGLEIHSNTNVNNAAIVVLPLFTENLNQLYLEFWSRPESDPSASQYGSGRLEIGYVTDVTDASTFVVVDSISVYNLEDSAYRQYRVNFGNVNLGDASEASIAFRHVPITDWYWYIDDVTVTEIPECMEPTQLLSSNITTNSVDLSWNSTAESVTLSYKEASATEYTNVENVSLDEESGVYTLSGLQSNTTYNWKVSFVCSDEQTYTSSEMIFKTTCDAISTVPQSWDFETDNTGGSTFNPLPACWTRYGSYPFTSTNVVARSGATALYFYESGTGILPQIDIETLPINTLQLSLWAKRNATSSDFNMEVGVMTDPTDPTTFTVVSNIALTDTYTFFEVPFTNYTGQGTYIALRNNTYQGATVDDVTLDLIPACTRPSDITVTASSDNATLTWNSTGEDFEIYYKESSETDYSLATATISAGTTNNTWTATVSGLDPNTSYDLYVKALCEEGSSLESSVVSFITTCVAIASVPQTWDFEEAGNTAGTPSAPLPACWTRTNAYQPSCAYGEGYAYQGSYSLHSYNNSGLAVLPQIDTETLPINTLQLSFYGRSGDWGDATVEVGVMTDPTDATTFTVVSSETLTSTYTLYEIDLTSYTGTGAYIALRNVSSTSMYVDNMTLDNASDCSRPTAVTVAAAATQATMTWNSTGESFEIYYKTSTANNYDIADATITAGATEGTWTATVNALNPSTLYNIYVKVLCGEGQEAQSNVVTFRTECTTIGAFPYTEDFESLSDSDLGCWTNENVSGSHSWTIREVDNQKFAYRTHQQGSSYLISPIFDITSLNSPALSYNWEATRYSSDRDSLYVYYRTSPAGDWNVLVAHGPSRASDLITPSQDTVIALPNASTTYQIAFLASCHYGYGVAIDNVMINDSTVAVSPIEPTVATNNTSNIAQTSVTLNGTITDAGNQTITAKGFEWKTTNNGTYTQVLSSDAGNTFTYNLTNLTANTSYTYRAFASTANGTVYGAEIVFTTLGDEPCTTVIASFSETICDGETFTFNGQSYTTSGEYTTLVAGQNGDCDTSYTITLTVLPSVIASITETLCYGETFTFNGQTYNATGTYTSSVASQTGGCDTLYTINLTVLPQNEPINEEITISQSELPYEYHGQTYNDFGTYSVTLQDENGCDQVYNLTLVDNSGIAEVEGGLTISLYPNPTDNNATLRVKGLNEQATIIITDQQGRVVQTKVLPQGTETFEVESERLASGVYYIRIQTTNTIRTEKLIRK